MTGYGHVLDRRRNPVVGRGRGGRGTFRGSWPWCGRLDSDRRGPRADRDAQPGRVQDEHDRQGGGGYTRRLCGKRRRPSVSYCAISSLPTAGSRVRRGRVTRAPAGDLLLAASLVRGRLVGYVCASMWITCAKRHRACARAVEMLGIPPPGRAHKRVFNWENTTRALCIQKKRELSTPRAAKAYK